MSAPVDDLELVDLHDRPGWRPRPRTRPASERFLDDRHLPALDGDRIEPDHRIERAVDAATSLLQSGLDDEDWPYEHAPGEARPIDGPHPEALEDAPGGYW